MPEQRKESDEVSNYIDRLSEALARLPHADRAPIVQEIYSHLAMRSAAVGSSRAVEEMGSPETVAAAYLHELSRSGLRVSRSWPEFIMFAAKRACHLTASAGAYTALTLSALLAVVAVAKIAAPSSTGVWRDPQSGMLQIGIIDAASRTNAIELFGVWLIPAAAVGAVLAFALARPGSTRALAKNLAHALRQATKS